ncbi:hypothetical protein B484DRAFT_410033 [Ochromonadaceae sp. CCMP2298]|nr:hypothetical protein B484DRAFT_410033 [Ochromonadaceae sp. CCMP2298]
MSDNSKAPSDDEDEASQKSTSSKEDTDAFNLSETPVEAPVESAKKKRKVLEHHATTKSRELAKVMRLQEKVMKMEESGKTEEEMNDYIISAATSMSRDEMDRMIVHTSTGNTMKQTKSHEFECDVCREIVVLESADAERKKYFEDMAKATRTGVKTEITRQTDDLKRYKLRVKKATANLRRAKTAQCS